MNIQSALENLAKVFLIFYISCEIAGRLDVPIRLIATVRAQSFAGLSTSWGCPSTNKKACGEYDPKIYKKR